MIMLHHRGNVNDYRPGVNLIDFVAPRAMLPLPRVHLADCRKRFGEIFHQIGIDPAEHRGRGKTKMNAISAAEIRHIAQQLAPRITALRRDFHAHPELGYEERRTCRRIAAALKSYGLDRVRAPVAGTGVVGLLAGRMGGGQTVALRADIDALPVHEENRVPYKSRSPGVMHACGHDAHAAMCLGAAMILSRLRDRFAGGVKFIFQPAEEKLGGAEAMIRAGALDNPSVAAIFGLHVMPEIEFGTLSTSPGPAWAATDRFKIEIAGRGGHAAWHAKCIDPILAAHAVYSGLQSIQRNLLGTDARVISVSVFNSGTAFNIVPDKAFLEGTVRTFDKRVQATIIRRMRAIVRGVASAYGAKGKLNYEKNVPATVNDEKADGLMRQAARLMGRPVKPAMPSMGGEDFAFYQLRVPGAISRLGACLPGRTLSLHSSRFDIDERILPIGSSILAQCALLALENWH